MFFNSAFAALTLLLTLAGTIYGQSPAQTKPLAVIGDERITEDQLTPQMMPQLQHLRKQEFEAKRTAVEFLIGERLEEKEATSRGIRVAELLEKEVSSRLPAVTDGEAEVFYLLQQNVQMPPLQTILPQVKERVKELRFQAARNAYRQTLWKKHKAAILLRPASVDVSYDPARLRGKPDAPVKLVEFTDFQCPYCSRVQSVLSDLKTKYGDQLSIAVRDFPLRQIHPLAQKAATASRCAGEQGKYWEYHDLIFGGAASLEEAGLMKHAASLKLNEPKFQACLGSGKFDDAIEQDFQDGRRLGVNGTPAFFVNGIPVGGTQGIAEFEKVIDSELAVHAAGLR